MSEFRYFKFTADTTALLINYEVQNMNLQFAPYFICINREKMSVASLVFFLFSL